MDANTATVIIIVALITGMTIASVARSLTDRPANRNDKTEPRPVTRKAKPWTTTLRPDGNGPIGAPGTITSAFMLGGYGVLFDADTHRLPCHMNPDEIEDAT